MATTKPVSSEKAYHTRDVSGKIFGQQTITAHAHPYILGCPNWNTNNTGCGNNGAYGNNSGNKLQPIGIKYHRQRITHIVLYFTIPVSTSASSTYTTVQMMSEYIMPLGRSVAGLYILRRGVEIASKPNINKEDCRYPFILFRQIHSDWTATSYWDEYKMFPGTIGKITASFNITMILLRHDRFFNPYKNNVSNQDNDQCAGTS